MKPLHIALSSAAAFIIMTGCTSTVALPSHDTSSVVKSKSYMYSPAKRQTASAPAYNAQANDTHFNTERYDALEENDFKSVAASPLSTLAIDVDTASYTNIRRMIDDEDRLPVHGAVRIEEMINYFSYDYPQPDAASEHPFTITTELTKAPWSDKNKLLLIGLQAKSIPLDQLPPSNLVALIDVSGSMQSDLPLVKQSIKLLAKQLRAQDRLSIVSYADGVRVVLEPTTGDQYEAIANAVDSLLTWGATNGEAGIGTAYALAKKTYMPKGNNRVVMFTDGDFNVGKTSSSEIVDIVANERKSGIYLSVLGYGQGNYNDATMEKVADNGNGNYNYVNDLLDAKKVFSQEMSGTLYTLGKDVKFQVEFNPAQVASYRLIGYENRLLDDEDFNDDTKDAGEIGVGHSVTALYEIVSPEDANDTAPSVDPLKYQTANPTAAAGSDEIATVKMRYKAPDGETSKLFSVTANNDAPATDNIAFASSVAGFGMLLRDSRYKGSLTYNDVVTQAKNAKGSDRNGHRAVFIKMVEKAELLQQQ